MLFSFNPTSLQAQASTSTCGSLFLLLPCGSCSWGTHSSDVICSVVAMICVCFARQQSKQTAATAPGSKSSSGERGDAHTCVRGAAVLRNGTWLSQDQVSPLCCLSRLWTGIPIALATDKLSWVLSPLLPPHPTTPHGIFGSFRAALKRDCEKLLWNRVSSLVGLSLGSHNLNMNIFKYPH